MEVEAVVSLVIFKAVFLYLKEVHVSDVSGGIIGSAVQNCTVSFHPLLRNVIIKLINEF